MKEQKNVKNLKNAIFSDADIIPYYYYNLYFIILKEIVIAIWDNVETWTLYILVPIR